MQHVRTYMSARMNGRPVDRWLMSDRPSDLNTRTRHASDAITLSLNHAHVT